MRLMVVLVAAFSSAIALAAGPYDGTEAGSERDLDRCLAAQQDFGEPSCTAGEPCAISCEVDLSKKYDAELNLVYRQLRTKLRGGKAEAELVSSERAWIAQRDHECIDNVVDGMGKDDVSTAHLQISGMENGCVQGQTWQRLQYLINRLHDVSASNTPPSNRVVPHPEFIELTSFNRLGNDPPLDQDEERLSAFVSKQVPSADLADKLVPVGYLSIEDGDYLVGSYHFDSSYSRKDLGCLGELAFVAPGQHQYVPLIRGAHSKIFTESNTGSVSWWMFGFRCMHLRTGNTGYAGNTGYSIVIHDPATQGTPVVQKLVDEPFQDSLQIPELDFSVCDLDGDGIDDLALQITRDGHTEIRAFRFDGKRFSLMPKTPVCPETQSR